MLQDPQAPWFLVLTGRWVPGPQVAEQEPQYHEHGVLSQGGGARRRRLRRLLVEKKIIT